MDARNNAIWPLEGIELRTACNRVDILPPYEVVNSEYFVEALPQYKVQLISYPNFEHLASIAETPISNYWGSFGQRLEQLHCASETLAGWISSYENPFRHLEAPSECLPTQVVPSLHQLGLIDFDDLLQFFEKRPEKRIDLARRQFLAWILAVPCANELLRNITRKIQALKKILHKKIANFCGLSWSRRLWFLLHGSHPPKLESWPVVSQEFECARA